MTHRILLVVGVLIGLDVCTGHAADQLILGKKLSISNPTGTEDRRGVGISGAERPTDVSVLADPTSSGATLTVVANGATPTSESFVLDASGWKPIRGGYRYTGPTGADGDPVRQVKIKLTASGASIKASLSGGVGIQALDTVPPNPGVDGGLVLKIGPERYCVAFGGAAGGKESRNTAQSWRISKPTAEAGCPEAPTTTTTTVTTTTTTTEPPGPSPLCPQDPSRIIFAGGPGTGACHQFDGDHDSCEKAFHLSPCGPASCYYDFNYGSCNGCGPQNRQSGSCINTCTEGAPTCPGDPSRTIFAGFSGNSSCTYLSFDRSLCERAFQMDGAGVTASCWWDDASSECRGCGPYNMGPGLCTNTCPVCPGDPSRTIFGGGPFTADCHRYDASPDSCAGAFVYDDNRVQTSCFHDGGQCQNCDAFEQADGNCQNSCPVCGGDTSRQIFVGGPNTSACRTFDYNPSLCEQSFHLSGDCLDLTSCFYNFDFNECMGCGTSNQSAGLCSNTCEGPICGDGKVDLPDEQCDGADQGSCAGDQLCSFDCRCQPCASTTIPAQGGSFFGTTSGPSSFNPPSGCAYSAGAPEQVYEWTPATSGLATIRTCGSSFDTVLYVRQGSCTGPTVACNDDYCGVQSRVTPFVTAGTPYFIVVDGYASSSGNFVLTVQPASPSGAFLDG
jgi:hypothetical protein